MKPTDATTVLCIAPVVFRDTVLNGSDLFDYYDPAATAIAEGEYKIRIDESEVERCPTPVLFGDPALSTEEAPHSYTGGGQVVRAAVDSDPDQTVPPMYPQILSDSDPQVVSIPQASDMEWLSVATEHGIDPKEPTGIITNSIGVKERPSNLSTTLVGRRPYEQTLKRVGFEGTATTATTDASVNYFDYWGGNRVVGTGRMPGASGQPYVGIDFYPDGRVGYRKVRGYGLKRLDGVGRGTAERLRGAEYGTVSRIANAGSRSIRNISGIGSKIGMQISASAQAIEQNRIVPAYDPSFPYRPPIFVTSFGTGTIDSPQTPWLYVGYDPETDDRCVEIYQKDRQPDAVTDAFLSWVGRRDDSRPLVAYDGWNRVFEALDTRMKRAHSRKYDSWADRYKYDIKYQATEKGSFGLPGYTNTLRDVAIALGDDPATESLVQTTVSGEYHHWRYHPTVSDPDWDAIQTLGVDRIRMIRTVFRALSRAVDQ